MLHLNIRTTNFQLNMKADPGKADPSMPEPTGKGTNIMPQNKERITPAFVHIDSTPSREALGLYTWSTFAKKLNQYDQQKVSSGTARRMREGRQVRDGGQLSNVIANIARQNTLPELKGLTTRFMPAPEISVTPSKIEGSIDPGTDKIAITPGKYTLDYAPAKENISVGRYASVKMWTTGSYDIYT